MKINIYINNRPLDEYPPEELEAVRNQLSTAAMTAAGYIKEEQRKN